ncbi:MULTISPECIES: ATP-binding protein [unclassified Streptomyces]|uniref:ATP-binding protein n=1 Tax=unclassified Streptomyces TaxID=2593676 RepID=UPI00131BA8FC|nr:ATP-binding protein [Streptomyces sp. CB01201]
MHQRVCTTAEAPETARARAQVVDAIRQTAPATSEDRVNDALLVVTELITNAVRHGEGLSACKQEVQNGRLFLHVADHSDRLPVIPSRPDCQPSEGGYGWSIVQTLADRVSLRSLPSGGKEICAVLSLA